MAPLARIAATHPLKLQENQMLNLDVGDRGSADTPGGVDAMARVHVAQAWSLAATPERDPRTHGA